MNSERELLIRSTDHLELYMSLCALAVAVGVAWEVWDAWKEHRSRSFMRVARVILPPALVAIGVFGEWLIGMILANRQAQIRQIDDATIAQERRRAAEAELALQQLIQKQTPRKLSTGQRKRLSQILAKLSPGHITIGHPLGEVEAGAYASEFVDAFRAAGWKTDFHAMDEVDFGVCLSFRPDLVVRSVNALHLGLNELGIEHEYGHNKDLSGDAPILLFVGYKNRIR